MALERDPGVVDRRLLHRGGHHRAEAAGDAPVGGCVQQGEHVSGIRGVRPARRRRRAERCSHHGQGSGTVRHRRRVGTPFHRCKPQSETAGAGRQQSGIAGEDEFAGPVGEGRRERQVRPDAGGLAGRDDYPSRAQGFLIST